MAIKLYDLAGAEDDRRFSPYCWRVKMALKHKGLPFETIPWRFTEKNVIEFTGSKTRALTHFFSHWTVRTVHVPLLRVILLDLFGQIHEKDKAYFRESREKRFGMPLEQAGGETKKWLAEFRGALEPVRPVLVQNQFVSGKGPGFADYILFGPFQWARCVSPMRLLEPDDPVYAWRERMLDLWDGYGRQAKGFPVWA
jgi:glutathione S-transferase